MSIGKKIKKYRVEKGITQTQLAEQIGSYQKNISTYEKDEVIPSAEVIKKIADSLEVSLDYLLSDGQYSIGDELSEPDKNAILRVIQAFLRDVKMLNKR